MAENQTDIANMALSHLGVGTTIENLETDRSAEAKSVRTFYDSARKELLRLTPWPFATKYATLSLITSSEDDDHETDDWGFVYQYPSDCVFMRRIATGFMVDTRDSLIDYELVHNNTGIRIYTDQEDARIEYTKDVETVQLFPPDFVQALSLRIAAYIAPRITGQDSGRMGDRALKFYQLSYSIAAATALNEVQNRREPESDLARVRG